MKIIPVIDLLGGQVVHAKRGDRQHYLPISSSLCKTSQPLDVLNGLLELYPFDCIYIADINAIQKNGHHIELVQHLKSVHPEIDFWLDAGFDSVEAISDATNLNIVLGSESISSLDHYQQLAEATRNQHVLSLDFKHGEFHGPKALLASSELWPERVIVMSLNKVGSNSGPDIEQLAAIRELAESHSIYAAGGVRNADDLIVLKELNLNGVLVASALHNGKLDRASLLEAEPN